MNITFVEDDPIQRKAVCAWLSEAGHQCHCFDSYQSYTAEHPDPAGQDLLLLDWELPDRSGLELLRSVRRQDLNLPVMFLTCRAEEEDIVSALHNGADDYLIKPARRNEFLARIEALTRRKNQLTNTSHKQLIGPFELDLHSRKLHRNGRLLSLTQKEFSLAYYLLNNIGQLITRQELLEEVWQQSASINTRTVDTHISRLRKKLELLPEQGWHLTAVYQYGYRLDWLMAESA